MKPILFNTEMTRAILDGRKTVTRRVIKPRYREDEGGFQVCTNTKTGEQWVEKSDWDEGSFDPPRYIKPPYMPGDILYVRETWKNATGDLAGGGYALFDTFVYKADGKVKGDYPIDQLMIEGNWRPSIHMPKAAARIFLRVTDVRVERLQEITTEDCYNEGVPSYYEYFTRLLINGKDYSEEPEMKDSFSCLWNSTIKKKDLPLYGWESNPWVWVIEFERQDENQHE